MLGDDASVLRLSSSADGGARDVPGRVWVDTVCVLLSRARRLRVDFVVDFRVRICDSSGVRRGRSVRILRSRFFVPSDIFYCLLENVSGFADCDDDIRRVFLPSVNVGDARVLLADLLPDLSHGLVPDVGVLLLRESALLGLALVGELVGVDDAEAVFYRRIASPSAADGTIR